MMLFLGIITYFSALAAAGNALQCIKCHSSSPFTCNGTNVTCPPGYVCGSLYEELSNGVESHSSFNRGCYPLQECHFKGLFTIGDEGHYAQMRTAAECCYTDGCTPPLPAIMRSSNGLACPVCTSHSSITCNSSRTINCTGEENRCFLLTHESTGNGPPYLSALRGCATQSYCNRGNYSHSDGRTTTKFTIICTSGDISIQNFLLTPVIVCLLLLRWI
ncbi:hypothetical protein GDO81_001257 [Engystomops pustulosus]|uniref:UPAR/Ly6 domain-containing protein n=1 Tax=Engystomops pustulosus TaxID=76066 RepID=A0AAV7DEH9_ENGPU|nr:hypothetical protein GDO81_001257 [Engystomops pustulosus]